MVAMAPFFGLVLAVSALVWGDTGLSRMRRNRCARRCPPVTCPGNEWEVWRGKCYRLSDKGDWSEARDSCKTLGGKMVSPTREVAEMISHHYRDKVPWPGLWLDCRNFDDSRSLYYGPKVQASALWSLYPWLNELLDQECLTYFPDNTSMVVVNADILYEHENESESEYEHYWNATGQIHALCRQTPAESKSTAGAMFCFTTGKDGRLDEACFKKPADSFGELHFPLVNATDEIYSDWEGVDEGDSQSDSGGESP